jgi:hypothetical protein
MNTPTPVITHLVMLRADDPTSSRWGLFDYLSKQLDCGNGQTILFLECYSVNTEHPIYLEADVHNPKTGQGLKLRIPHDLIFLISDPSIEKKHIGFARSLVVTPQTAPPPPISGD